MNDLILRGEPEAVLRQIHSCFPNLLDGLRKAQSLFDRVKSFEDVELYLLRGAGLSPNTYRSYLAAVKQLYEFTDGLNPLQVTPGHIEAFYDQLAKKVDRNTASLRIRGLKRFFQTVAGQVPGYVSPFEVMEPALLKKLNRTKQGNRTKKALTVAEVRRLLAWLAEDLTVKGLEDYAIVFMLVTSGLRAAELVQLRWKDLELLEGTWTARFVGKGGKDAEQELFTPAVEACRAYFRAQFGRDPGSADALFWTQPSFDGDPPRPLPYHSLWRRVREVGRAAQEAGIITRELDFSPHLFRRSYATCLYKSGMGIKAIQEKTRHANIEVLVKHYIHDEEPASPYFAKMLS